MTEPQECRVVNNPLIPDSLMARWVLGIAATVLSLGLGWAANQLADISEATTRTLEDIELFQAQQAAINNRLDRVSQRVDQLYGLELTKGKQ